MKSDCIKRALVVLCVTLSFGFGFGTAAYAQFVGDIFAANPSQTAQTGENVTIRYEVFTGTTPFGAGQFELFYNETELEFIAAEPAGSFANGRSSYDAQPVEGEVELMVANGQSFDDPRGTVPLYDVTFRVLATSGTISNVAAVNIGILGTRKEDLTRGAFGAEIVVQSNQPKQTSEKVIPETVVLKVASDLKSRAEKLRRRGFPMEIVTDSGSLQSVMLLVED